MIKLAVAATACAPTLLQAAVPGAYGNITFDLYLDSTVTSTRSIGVSWKIGTVANAGTEAPTQIGITLQSVTPNGGSSSVPSGFGSTAGITGGFCTELGQSVGLQNGLSYEWVPLNKLDYYDNIAQESGISAGGIGTSKAVLVQILFDKYYTSIAPAAGASTTVQDNRAAFQVALWKLTHQAVNGTVAASNWSLNYTAGSTTTDTFGYITTPSAADLNVLTPAQTYITAVIAQYATSGDSYVGTTKLLGLASSTTQDLLVVSNNPNFVSAVPETSTWAAAGFVALAIGGTAWRRTRKTKTA